MLETLRSQINRKKCDPTQFEDKFIAYIMEEQDKALEHECKYLMKVPDITPLSIDRLLSKISKELKELTC